MSVSFKCHVGIGPVIEGEALVAKDNFSARYDLDRIKGVFSRPQHALAGQSRWCCHSVDALRDGFTRYGSQSDTA